MKEPLIQAQAKENQIRKPGDSVVQKSSPQSEGKSREQVAKLAGVSHDTVHNRAYGTASRNFRENRERFIDGVDYYKVCADEIRRHNLMPLSNKAQEAITLITESGYLMLAKSLTDDLAWKVQRIL